MVSQNNTLTDVVRAAMGKGRPLTHEIILDHMVTPPESVINTLEHIDGSIAVLGAGGKMGEELVIMIANAIHLMEDSHAAHSREIHAVSRYGNGVPGSLKRLNNVTVHQADLFEPGQLARLPDVDNVIYMIGHKFGTDNERAKIQAYRTNVLLPEKVAMRYPDSRIVVFSSGNPCPLTTARSGGPTESVPFNATKPYGKGIECRENSFRAVAEAEGTQLAFYRLWYAQHVCYGAIVDLAKRIKERKKIYLENPPAVNLISQGDANAAAINALACVSNLATGKRPSVDIDLHSELEQYGTILNVTGPIVTVDYITKRLGEVMGIKPIIVSTTEELALLGNDTRYTRLFGDYRDSVHDMITAAGLWVKNNGKDWDKPTHFGKQM